MTNINVILRAVLPSKKFLAPLQRLSDLHGAGGTEEESHKIPSGFLRPPARSLQEEAARVHRGWQLTARQGYPF